MDCQEHCRFGVHVWPLDRLMGDWYRRDGVSRGLKSKSAVLTLLKPGSVLEIDHHWDGTSGRHIRAGYLDEEGRLLVG